MFAQAGPSRLRQTPAVHGRSQEEENTLALFGRLSLQEINDFEGGHRTNHGEGPVSDAELALSIFLEDARSLQRFNSDRAMALALGESADDPFPTTQAAQPPPIPNVLRPQNNPAPRVVGVYIIMVQQAP